MCSQRLPHSTESSTPPPLATVWRATDHALRAAVRATRTALIATFRTAQRAISRTLDRIRTAVRHSPGSAQPLSTAAPAVPAVAEPTKPAALPADHLRTRKRTSRTTTEPTPKTPRTANQTPITSTTTNRTSVTAPAASQRRGTARAASKAGSGTAGAAGAAGGSTTGRRASSKSAVGALAVCTSSGGRSATRRRSKAQPTNARRNRHGHAYSPVDLAAEIAACLARPPRHPPPWVALAALLLASALFGPGGPVTPALTALGTPSAGESPADAPQVRFGWPLRSPHPVLRPFEPPATPYGPGHRGVDLGGLTNEAVLAAGDGMVLYAGPVAGRGVVSIEHANGLRTTYEPILPAVRVGDQVTRGQVIGYLQPGHPGCPLPSTPPPAPQPPTPPAAPSLREPDQQNLSLNDQLTPAANSYDEVFPVAVGPQAQLSQQRSHQQSSQPPVQRAETGFGVRPAAPPNPALQPQPPAEPAPAAAPEQPAAPRSLPGRSAAGSTGPGQPQTVPVSSTSPATQPTSHEPFFGDGPTTAVGSVPGGGAGQLPMVCLHWGVRRGRQYLDPLRLVEAGQIRLLPWPADVP